MRSGDWSISELASGAECQPGEAEPKEFRPQTVKLNQQEAKSPRFPPGTLSIAPPGPDAALALGRFADQATLVIGTVKGRPVNLGRSAGPGRSSQPGGVRASGTGKTRSVPGPERDVAVLAARLGDAFASCGS